MKAVKKEAGVWSVGLPDEGELALINRFAKTGLKAEEVYAFSVKLCDNEVDRDFERFPVETLEELAPLFVGKSGIFDHQWSAGGQTARIYRTEVVHEKSIITAAGDEYCYLKGWVYMLRTEKNLPLIQEIEGGIKKEVSVGCAVNRAACSVCGKERKAGCEHVPGKEYGGKLCWTELLEAADAYEFSFVAVPAQPRAGVMKKGMKGVEEMEQLEKEAALGRKYLERLRAEVVRLGGLAEPDLKMETLRTMAGGLEEESLLELRRVYAKRAGGSLPVTAQLPRYGESVQTEGRDSAFLI